MRRLLSVVHYPVFGGPHNRVARLAGPLAQRGWESVALLPEGAEAAAARLADAGVEIVQLPLKRLRATRDPRPHAALAARFRRDVSAIRRVLRDREIDLVLASGIANPQAALAGRRESVPVLWQILDSRTPALGRRVLMPVAFHLADALLFNGRALVRLHGAEGAGVPVVVAFPPVDTSVFRPSDERRAATRAELGVPPDGALVGVVANLNPLKGIELFIETAARVHRADPETWFVVVGARHATHAAYAARLEADLAASGLPAGRFRFLGPRSDLEAFYPALDVKLVTSRTEGSTTTALEAMACAVPVVAVDVGSVSEAIENGNTGVIVPPLDADALTRETLRLLAHAAERRRLGDSARVAAVERFDTEVVADVYERAFEEARRHAGSRARRSMLRRLRTRNLGED